MERDGFISLRLDADNRRILRGGPAERGAEVLYARYAVIDGVERRTLSGPPSEETEVRAPASRCCTLIH